MLAWSSLHRNTAYPMFNLGSIQTATSIPFTSLQREKMIHSLTQFSPSTSLPQLWGKKTLNKCLCLVLVDVFILCSLARVNNRNCDLGEQAGKLVTLLREFLCSLKKAGIYFLGFGWDTMSAATLFLLAQHLHQLFCYQKQLLRRRLAITYTEGL